LDGSHVFTVSSDKTARIWEVATGAEASSFEDPRLFQAKDPIFSPDGSKIIAFPGDNSLQLFDPMEAKQISIMLPEGRASFDRNLHALLERKRRLMRDALLPPNATEADRNELFQATIN
jgi:WD40 repeat protein